MFISFSAIDSPQSSNRLPSTGRGRANTANTYGIWPLLILTAGFLLRIIPAWRFFLNPDEALHHLLSDQPTLALAYKAALTNSHPPLLILVLYYVRLIGQSEFVLRLPSVLAGTTCCWFVYQWLKLIADRRTAFIGLLLSSFAPAMIELSSEIRQYALLMFFIAACLYLSERAVREDSPLLMILFSLSLYGALFVHYSSLLFAAVIGIFMLIRLYPYSSRMRLASIWAAGQMVGAAIACYYVFTHMRKLRETGMVHSDFETYLRKSIYHPGDINPLAFVAGQTLRVFTYLLSHGVMGTLALIAFAAGIALLLRTKSSSKHTEPTPHQLALLLGLPFLINCAAALASLYPYGGTRHAAWLLIFAIAGASIGLARIPGRLGITALVITAALAVCNFFPAPPPLIRPRNQNRALMANAVSYLRQNVSPGALVFADYESALELGYYACGHGIVQEFPPFETYVEAPCGLDTVITPRPDSWKFYAGDLTARLNAVSAQFHLTPGTKLWLFDAGWITDSAPSIARDPNVACLNPHFFGENVFLCQLTVPPTAEANSKASSENPTVARK